LIHTIEDRIQRRELDGLLSQVDRAVKLQGNREDLLKLQGQLRDRETKLTSQRDDAYAKAKELVKEGKAKAALELLKGVRCVELTNSQYALKRDIEAMVASETELTAMVKEAKAVGVIEPAEVVVLLPKAVECLALNPNHAAIRKLRDDLLMRLHQCTGEVLALLPPEVLSKLPSEVRSKVFSQNSIGMKFHLLPAGEFKMGASDKDCRVTLTKPFQLGVYPVTQEQYRRVMRKDPSNFKGSQNPVEKVSWKDAVEFCRRLSALPEEKAAGRVYRLPTEAEWEYACRAGTTTDFSFGDDQSQLGEYAWYAGNSGQRTHPVGVKQSNPWGLYDMHGNVWEWCQDWYAEDLPEGAVTDPTGPVEGSSRVIRGGSWSSIASLCRSSLRYGDTPDYRHHDHGFRVLHSSVK
jgi:formylglycine-generating enzyme required for sulfatase activity